MLGEFPGSLQNLDTLVRSFDHVNHVAKIDDVSRPTGGVRPMGRVPPPRPKTIRLEGGYVVAATAPVVEEAPTRAEYFMRERQSNWPGKVLPAHRCAVAR